MASAARVSYAVKITSEVTWLTLAKADVYTVELNRSDYPLFRSTEAEIINFILVVPTDTITPTSFHIGDVVDTSLHRMCLDYDGWNVEFQRSCDMAAV